MDIVGLNNNEWAMGIAVSLTGIATFVAIPLAGKILLYNHQPYFLLIASLQLTDGLS